MAKTQQEELKLQSDLMGGLRGDGFYCEKQSERFKAGRPDLRIARADQGQLDAELKYVYGSLSDPEIEFGFTKLQWLKMREMNEHGIPAVGLVYLASHNFFILTLDMVLRPGETKDPRVCLKLPAPRIIDGVALFETAKGLLRDAGYKHRW
jgi:hypothetical protein